MNRSMRMRVLQRKPSFSQNCLPLCQEFAQLTKELIRKKLDNLPSGWSFEDRVLVYLLPSFKKDVHQFYADGRTTLPDTLESHQIEHLDKTLLLEMLVKSVEKLSPGLLAALRKNLKE